MVVVVMGITVQRVDVGIVHNGLYKIIYNQFIMTTMTNLIELIHNLVMTLLVCAWRALH